MAATAQQQLDAANDALLRILQTDSESWGENERWQHQLQIDKLYATIERLESKVASSAGRRIFQPMRRIDA